MNYEPGGLDVPINAEIVVTFSENKSIRFSMGNILRFEHEKLKYGTMYTVKIYAEDLVGNSVEHSWSFTTESSLAPVAFLTIDPNPVDREKDVTIVGYGRDLDEEVVKYSLILPSGKIITEKGDYLKIRLDPKDVESGIYRFVAKDDGLSSEVVMWLISNEVKVCRRFA